METALGYEKELKSHIEQERAAVKLIKQRWRITL